MRNINLEAAIWYLFTSTPFMEAAAHESDEIKDWFGAIAMSRRVEGFGKNGQVFDTFKRTAINLRRGVEMASSGDFEFVWKVASYVRGDVRGLLEQPFHAWMSESDYDEFFNKRIGKLTSYTTRIAISLNNAIESAESFFSPHPEYPERSNDDDGFPGDEIVNWYTSYCDYSATASSPILPDPLPVYRIDTAICCKTGDEVPWTGVWYPATGLDNHSLAFAVKGLRMQPAYKVIKTKDQLRAEGYQAPVAQTVAVATTWHPVIPCARQQESQDKLRAKAGQPCPKPGVWQQVDANAAQRRYQLGETMANLGSAYGFTVWRWLAD